jgi:hypothetical protein
MTRAFPEVCPPNESVRGIIEPANKPHMRRTLSIAGASLGLHVLLFLLFDGYRELAFRVGLFFPHSHDTADILLVGGTGFAVLAIAMVGAGVLFERLLRGLRHGTRGSAE